MLEPEDWPRGRIVFDRARDLFILYAYRKLLTLASQIGWGCRCEHCTADCPGVASPIAQCSTACAAGWQLSYWKTRIS